MDVPAPSLRLAYLVCVFAALGASYVGILEASSLQGLGFLALVGAITAGYLVSREGPCQNDRLLPAFVGALALRVVGVVLLTLPGGAPYSVAVVGASQYLLLLAAGLAVFCRTTIGSLWYVVAGGFAVLLLAGTGSPVWVVVAYDLLVAALVALLTVVGWRRALRLLDGARDQRGV